MFISEPYAGNYYIAEPSRKGARKLLWSRMSVKLVEPDERIDVQDVPRRIRLQAYRKLYRTRAHHDQ